MNKQDKWLHYILYGGEVPQLDLPLVPEVKL
jgi:hypothetical protein